MNPFAAPWRRIKLPQLPKMPSSPSSASSQRLAAAAVTDTLLPDTLPPPAADVAGMASRVLTELWTTRPTDFVYSVDLSYDLQYCVYAGTDKTLHVLNGKTGEPRFELTCSAPIWTVALLDVEGAGDMVAFGGEFGQLSIVSLDDPSSGMHLPVTPLIHSACVTDNGICYANGCRATILGGGGYDLAWSEAPSVGMAVGLIMATRGNDLDIVNSLGNLIEKHPAAANFVLPDGRPLLQYVIERSPQPTIVTLLLNADCRLHLTESILRAALDSGKRRIVQQLLEALRGTAGPSQFASNSPAVAAFAACLETISDKYPQDYLELIKEMPMVPEPEVLDNVDVSDVLLPRRFIRGSSERSPRALWQAELMANRLHADDAIGFEEGGGSLVRSDTSRQLGRRASAEMSTAILSKSKSRRPGNHRSLIEMAHFSPVVVKKAESTDERVPLGFLPRGGGNETLILKRIPFEYFGGGYYDPLTSKLRPSPMHVSLHPSAGCTRLHMLLAPPPPLPTDTSKS